MSLNKKVVIRVDGNTKIGLGHIYRGIALADILKDNYIVEFVTRKNSTISPIQDLEFNYKFIPDEVKFYKESNWFKENYSIDTIIVLDGYDFDELYQQKIKNLNYRLVYIDDFAKGKQRADLVINHSPGVVESDYKKEKYTDLALGLKYALLRKSFIEFDRTKIPVKNKVNTVFISFGGADSNDFSFLTVKEVMDLESIRNINVVLGAANKNSNIFKLESSKLKIHKNLSEQDIFKLMREADLAIVPSSTTSIELASLGIPMILGYFVDNQKGIYDGFLYKKAVIPIDSFNKYNFKNIITEIEKLDNKYTLLNIQNNLLAMFKGNIKANIIIKFNNLC